MLKNGLQLKEKRGISWVEVNGKERQRLRPWLGDLLAFTYDSFMEKKVFPKKFGADFQRHGEYLQELLGDVWGEKILELAAGTGSAAEVLPRDNRYVGIDVSPGLLRRAEKRFRKAGWQEIPEKEGMREALLVVSAAEDLPFHQDAFSLILCFLSLNFFRDADSAVEEAARVLVGGGKFLGAVPVPERKTTRAPIRGTLLTAEEWKDRFNQAGFNWEELPERNGCLLYFSAVLRR